MTTTPTLYCAPCTSDLALVREAVTFVSGTASCAAHAVLLTHPHDNPGRRRARLAQLRQLAESKVATAPPEDQPGLELLIHEYTLAGAMDMGGQPRPDGSPRRERGALGRGDQPQGGAGQSQGGAGQPGQPGLPGEGRSGKRRGRGRDRAQQVAGEGGQGVGPDSSSAAGGQAADGTPAAGSEVVGASAADAPSSGAPLSSPAGGGVPHDGAAPQADAAPKADAAQPVPTVAPEEVPSAAVPAVPSAESALSPDPSTAAAGAAQAPAPEATAPSE